MRDLRSKSADLEMNEQDFLTVQELSQSSVSNNQTEKLTGNQSQTREQHLPNLEINGASSLGKVSQSAKDLGAPLEASIESKSDLNSLLPRRIDPRSISFRIGRGTPQPYYDRYAAGISVTATQRNSSSAELSNRTDLSVGVGAEYANPNTRVQIFAQPFGSEQRYGIKFSTSF